MLPFHKSFSQVDVDMTCFAFCRGHGCSVRMQLLFLTQ